MTRTQFRQRYTCARADQSDALDISLLYALPLTLLLDDLSSCISNRLGCKGSRSDLPRRTTQSLKLTRLRRTAVITLCGTVISIRTRTVTLAHGSVLRGLSLVASPWGTAQEDSPRRESPQGGEPSRGLPRRQPTEGEATRGQLTIGGSITRFLLRIKVD